MALRDRLSSLSRGELVGIVVVLAITLGGAGLWYARSLPKPVEIGAPASVGTGVPVSATTSPTGAPLTDGTQVLVPSSAGAAGTPAVPGAPGGTVLINVNTASASELETLSGIGEVLAAEIVSYRTENGPFASVDELDEVSGIGPATLEDIRDQVTV